MLMPEGGSHIGIKSPLRLSATQSLRNRGLGVAAVHDGFVVGE